MHGLRHGHYYGHLVVVLHMPSNIRITISMAIMCNLHIPMFNLCYIDIELTNCCVETEMYYQHVFLTEIYLKIYTSNLLTLTLIFL